MLYVYLFVKIQPPLSIFKSTISMMRTGLSERLTSISAPLVIRVAVNVAVYQIIKTSSNSLIIGHFLCKKTKQREQDMLFILCSQPNFQAIAYSIHLTSTLWYGSKIIIDMFTIPYHTVPYQTIPYHTKPYPSSAFQIVFQDVEDHSMHSMDRAPKKTSFSLLLQSLESAIDVSPILLNS